MRWQPGDIVEHRHVSRGAVWWRSPARVIEDSDDLTVLWWPAGTRYERAAFGERSEHLGVLARGRWEMEELEWFGGDALHVVPLDAPFSLWPFRLDDHSLFGWYVNLQAPLTRTARGFDTDDWTLDVVAATDRSTWAWKDEDELVEGERIGLYTAADVARIRDAGAQAVAFIEAGSPLFDQWAVWRPDPAWPTPTFAAIAGSPDA